MKLESIFLNLFRNIEKQRPNSTFKKALRKLSGPTVVSFLKSEKTLFFRKQSIILKYLNLRNPDKNLSQLGRDLHFRWSSSKRSLHKFDLKLILD